MEFICNKKYMILPASFHATPKRLCFYIGDKMVYDLMVALDYDQPDYQFPVNIERFAGQNLRVECNRDMDIRIELNDEATFDYSGKYRPLVHFTAQRGWINDPNGLVYYKGKYLMYFQHNPAATTWENMHWGAAESDDLIHWHEKGDALYPDEYGTMFSGSGFVDWDNATGLMKAGEPPLLFFYTSAGSTSETAKNQPFTQCLAYSYDGGKTLTKYSGNPLVNQVVGGNRDPKIVRYEPDGSYIMVIYLDNHEFMFLKSYNLLDWQETQRISMPEDAECPDFYPLSVDGDASNMKWVLAAASDRYYIGSFDGQCFTPETDLLQLNYGNNSYAAQSWSDVPDGRRIRTAFATVVIPGMPFGSCMNIPQVMTLRTVNGTVRLCAEPVEELRKLALRTNEYSAFPVEDAKPFRQIVNSKACDVTLQVQTGSSFTLSLYGMDIVYDAERSVLRCLDKEAPVKGVDGLVELRMIFDAVYTEIFADHGSVFMGMTNTLDSNLNRLTITGDVLVEQMTISELDAFWK